MSKPVHVEVGADDGAAVDARIAGSNHKKSAAWNRGLVIRLLRQHGLLSRRQISLMTGLRGSTLTYIMRELLEKDVVLNAGKLDSKRVGQKQVMLRMNPDFGWMLGVALRPDAARLSLLDAAGELIAEHRHPISGQLGSVPQEVARGLEQWMLDHPRPPGRLLGIGVGVPGVVNADAGIVLRSTPFHAENVPLQQRMVDQFGVTTIIDHDACFGAGAEAVEGVATGVSHFIYFLINYRNTDGRVTFDSYGAALYLGGAVYRGAHYSAGELNDPLLPPSLSFDEADIAALATVDAPISDRVKQLAEAIGNVLVPMIDLIDVELVVLAGTAGIKNQAIIDVIQSVIDRGLINVPGRMVRVAASGVRNNPVARGAAIAAADAVLLEGRLLSEVA